VRRAVRSAWSMLLAWSIPVLAYGQASPFMTGITSLQVNILAWLTPIAVILVMILGAMAMANRVAQVSGTYGQDDARTIVENCGNTLILRCSGSDRGGTTHFASQLIGQREVMRKSTSKSWRPTDFLASKSVSEHISVEPAVMDSQIEQLPDLTGYLKFASLPTWQRVTLAMPETPDASEATLRSGSNSDVGSDRMAAAATAFAAAVAASAKTAWSQWRASDSQSRRRYTPSPEPTSNPDASPTHAGRSSSARDGADTAL
jgi:hypothetical protein